MIYIILLNIKIKYLSYFELDLYIKKFPDTPETMNIYNNNNLYNNKEQENKEEEHKNGREYFFNDNSVVFYQEFEIVKMNKYKINKKEVLICIIYIILNIRKIQIVYLIFYLKKLKHN